MGCAVQISADAYKLLAKNDYAAAIPLLEKGLALREQAFGPKHQLVYTSLADAYDAINDRRAEAMWQRALTVGEVAFGADSDEVAGTAI